MYLYGKCIIRVNKSDVESGEKVITLQPGGENKKKFYMLKKMWKIWHKKFFGDQKMLRLTYMIW